MHEKIPNPEIPHFNAPQQIARESRVLGPCSEKGKGIARALVLALGALSATACASTTTSVGGSTEYNNGRIQRQIFNYHNPQEQAPSLKPGDYCNEVPRGTHAVRDTRTYAEGVRVEITRAPGGALATVTIITPQSSTKVSCP